MKLVEENIGYSLCDLELIKAFLDTIPKAKSVKEKNDKLGFQQGKNKLSFSKMKNLCTSKDNNRKIKRPQIERKYLEIIHLIRPYIHNT